MGKSETTVAAAFVSFGISNGITPSTALALPLGSGALLRLGAEAEVANTYL